MKWFQSTAGSANKTVSADVREVRGAKDEVTVDGRRLETLRFAPVSPGLPTIVMLHEGLGSIALWKDFPHRIAAQTGFGVFVYSRYGHGGSDALEEKRSVEFMHREAEVVLPLLLKDAGIERPLLLGHSDGSSPNFAPSRKRASDKALTLIGSRRHLGGRSANLGPVKRIPAGDF
jgi:pimeloyl-ACP methyl ester carboxylesterase